MSFELPHLGPKQAKADGATLVAPVDAIDEGTVGRARRIDSDIAVMGRIAG